MGLEVATYISDLVVTNPAGGDLKSTGDDHMRLIKSTLKNTFPNITGAVTATHTQLNNLVLSGSFTGTLTGVSGTVTGTIYYKVSNGVCTLYTKGVALSGTSTSTAMTITGLPSAVLPVSAATIVSVPTIVINNSSNFMMGYAAVTQSSSSISFYLATVFGSNITSGAFSNSGTKGINSDWAITYPL